LDNKLIQPQLLSCALQHPFLDTPFRNEPKNIDLLGLPNTMRTIHSLQIRLRVPVAQNRLTKINEKGKRNEPVAIVEDNNISCCQIDAQAARTRCQKKYKPVTIRFVILVNREYTILVSCSAINTTVFYKRM
jgi:hypothetical protein